MGDALRETSFVGLSLASQGLWTRMMMIMHDACKYGFLVNANGMQMSCKTLASVIGRPEPEIQALLDEMDSLGTFSRLTDGTIYNRRMMKVGDVSEKRAAAANARWGKEKECKADASEDALSHANDAPSSSVFNLQSSNSNQEPPIVPRGGPVAVPDSKTKALSPFQECLQKAAADMHSTHPAHRRDLSVSGTQKHLVSILKYKKLLTAAGKPLDEAMPYLVGIVGIHLRKTQSEDWTKEDAKYVKSLANYLAPSMDRYEQEPPPQVMPGTYPVRDGPRYPDRKARASQEFDARMLEEAKRMGMLNA